MAALLFLNQDIRTTASLPTLLLEMPERHNPYCKYHPPYCQLVYKWFLEHGLENSSATKKAKHSWAGPNHTPTALVTSASIPGPASMQRWPFPYVRSKSLIQPVLIPYLHSFSCVLSEFSPNVVIFPRTVMHHDTSKTYHCLAPQQLLSRNTFFFLYQVSANKNVYLFDRRFVLMKK